MQGLDHAIFWLKIAANDAITSIYLRVRDWFLQAGLTQYRITTSQKRDMRTLRIKRMSKAVIDKLQTIGGDYFFCSEGSFCGPCVSFDSACLDDLSQFIIDFRTRLAYSAIQTELNGILVTVQLYFAYRQCDVETETDTAAHSLGPEGRHFWTRPEIARRRWSDWKLCKVVVSRDPRSYEEVDECQETLYGDILQFILQESCDPPIQILAEDELAALDDKLDRCWPVYSTLF